MSDVLEQDPLENPQRPLIEEHSRPLGWRRVGLMELNQHWSWLVVRLKDRYPLAAERELRSHLMSHITDNDAFFICNDAAMWLFTVITRPLQYPRVEEQFCIAVTPEQADYAEALYEPVGVWVRRLGIRDLEYMCFSDATAFVARREAKALEHRARKVSIMVMEDHRGG